MRMVKVGGRSIMISKPKVGGLVHVIIGIGTLSLICQPQAQATMIFQLPFLMVAVFYAFYFPWTIIVSWNSIITSVKADLQRAYILDSED
jgi:hypothetical protein